MLAEPVITYLVIKGNILENILANLNLNMKMSFFVVFLFEFLPGSKLIFLIEIIKAFSCQKSVLEP